MTWREVQEVLESDLLQSKIFFGIQGETCELPNVQEGQTTMAKQKMMEEGDLGEW